MAASAQIGRIHGFNDPLSRPVMDKDNPGMYSGNLPRMYPIHRHINIFSVARRSFPVKHTFFRGELAGCTNGERYVKCSAIPDPPQQISDDAERGGKRVEVEPGDEAGWRVAIDILNPNNPTLDPYFLLNAKQAAYYATGQGVDLVRFGLFPSLNAEPTEAELRKAEAARDASYSRLVDDAFEVQASDPQNFRVWLNNNPDIYTAMEALGIEADWHKKVEVKQTCPNCGEQVKAGIAFHTYQGGVCVLDWKRTYEAGRVRKEDVPEGKEWWTEQAKRGPGRPPRSSGEAA